MSVPAVEPAFVTAIKSIEHHDRLRHAFERCIAGEHLSPLAAKLIDADAAVVGPEDHTIMAGSRPAPEPRLTAAAEHSKALRAEDPSAMFLHLGDSELGVSGTRALVSFLTPPVRSAVLTAHLSLLDISDNAATDFGKEFGPLRDLFFQAARMPRLRFLSLHNTTLLAPGAALLARLLRSSPSLRFLDASRCGIGEKGALALHAAFCREEDYAPEELAQAEEGEAGGAAAEGESGAAPENAFGAAVDALTTGRAGGESGAGASRPASASAAGAGAAAAEGASARRPSSAGAGVGFDASDPRFAAIATSMAADPVPLGHSAPGAGAGAGDAASGAGSRPGSASSRRPGSALRSRQAAAASAAPEGSAAAAPSSSRPSSASSRRAAATAASASVSSASSSAYGYGVRSIVEASNVSLTHLDLSSNNLAGFDNPMPAAKLARALAEHPALRWLDLSRTGMTRAVATQLVSGLATNTALRTLRLDGNGIQAVPAAAMAAAIAHHPCLATLSLRLNSVRSDGAAAFARLLASGTGIELPREDGSAAPLRPAPAAPEAAAAAAPGVVGRLSSLRQVDLRDNYIGPVGVRALLQALGAAPVVAAAAAAAAHAADASSAREHAGDHAHAHASGAGAGAAATTDASAPPPDTPVGAGVVLAGSGAHALRTLRRQQRAAALRALALGVGSTPAIAEEGEADAEGEEDEGAGAGAGAASASASSSAGDAAGEVSVPFHPFAAFLPRLSVSVTSDGDVVQVLRYSHAAAVAAGLRKASEAPAAAGKPPRHPAAASSSSSSSAAAPAERESESVLTVTRVVRLDGETVRAVMAEVAKEAEARAAAAE